MQHLEVSGAVRHIYVYMSLGGQRLISIIQDFHKAIPVHALFQASSAANCMRSTHFWDITQRTVLILSWIS